MNSNGTGVYADYSTGMWTCVAAMVSLFVGTLVLLFYFVRYVRDVPDLEEWGNMFHG